MTTLFQKLLKDDAGFVVSAELAIIATLVVIGMIVGLAEVAYGVNEELEDVGSAVGGLNQAYEVDAVRGHKARRSGSRFNDLPDFCDGQYDISCDTRTYPESNYGNNNY
ncbi:MAG: branched-chain amino acid aminotransferase [Planctomycetaceae bacterium]